jgi:hypothetical protein
VSGHAAWLVTRLVVPLVVDYFNYVRIRVPRHAARLVTRLVAPLLIDFFAYVARHGASAHRVAHHAARRQLLHLLCGATSHVTSLHRASGCLGTSHGLSCDSSLTTSPRAGSSSTTPPRAARRRLLRQRRASWCLGLSRHSSSTTSTTSRVRVPWHAARLVTRHVAPLVVDYAARPGASSHHAARHAARRAARRRLLHLRRTSGCFDTPRDLLRDSSSTTLHRAGSSSSTPPRAARRRLLRLCHTSGCLDSSRGSSHHSSSTTSTTPRIRVPGHAARLVMRLVMPLVIDYFNYARVRVPRHAARLVTRLVAPLVVDYFDYAARPGASACRMACHAARRAAPRRLLCLRRAFGCLGTSRGSSRGSSLTTSTTPHVRVRRHIARLITRLVTPLLVDYFTYCRAYTPGTHARKKEE